MVAHELFQVFRAAENIGSGFVCYDTEWCRMAQPGDEQKRLGYSYGSYPKGHLALIKTLGVVTVSTAAVGEQHRADV